MGGGNEIFKNDCVKPRVWDRLELACSEAGLDLQETETVTGCIRYHLNHGMRPGTHGEMLLRAIELCLGAKDCGLCLRVVGTKVCE